MIQLMSNKRQFAALANLTDTDLNSGMWMLWRLTAEGAVWMRHLDIVAANDPPSFYEIGEPERARLEEANLISDPIREPLRGVGGDDENV